jgi:O-antigen ligase
MDYGSNDLYEANRVYGFFGHANETGALVAVFLPAYVAVAMSEKGALRFGWLVAMMISVVVLIMTGSRGALAGLLIGGAIGAYMCRRYLTPAKLIRGGMLLAAIGLPVIALLGAKYGADFIQRMVSQGSAADVGEVSSGRTDLWMGAISRMMETPVSLITGFGWNVYDSMGFILVPHNHYILLWFELGLIGIACYLVVIRTLLRSALSGLQTATPEVQSYLIALVFAIMILSVAIIFEQLYKPWYYIWPYMGITLRAALLARRSSVIPQPAGSTGRILTGEVPATRS